jgi:hypothetical protein
MYRVFSVPEGYQVFWCPSAPVHYNDREVYIDPKNVRNNGVYTKRQAAYHRASELNKQLRDTKKTEDVASELQGIAY